MDAGRIAPARDRASMSLDVHGQLRPGLINAHDHLHRNHYPRLGSPPYADAYAWGRDIHEREAETIARARAVPRRDALLLGALKNLISGVTTVVHHDPWEPDFDHGFPINVAPVRCVHSLGIEPSRAADPPGDPEQALCIHLAEGVTREMAAEVEEADRLGLLDERLIAVHAVGVEPEGINLLARRNVAVAWCPTSNRYLFGRTAPRELLERVDLLLGSDSLLTGAGTLLNELQEARASQLVDDRRLAAAVGEVAAVRLHLPPPGLGEGARADVIVSAKPILEATWEDVKLVIVAGVPRVGEERYAPLFDHKGVAWEHLRVGAAHRIVSAPLASVAERVWASCPESRRIFTPSVTVDAEDPPSSLVSSA